jgi:hypothetical protein
MRVLGRPLMTEARQQPGQQQRARDTGQAPGDHGHRVAESGRDRSGLQVPIRGPPVTTAICSPDSRPRSASGAASWMIVLRNTTEITSAQSATARPRTAGEPGRSLPFCF